MDALHLQLHYQPAHELLGQLEAGTLTSEALVTALLDRIRDQNPAINAIVALDEHSALASAREADKQRALAGFLPRPHPRPARHPVPTGSGRGRPHGPQCPGRFMAGGSAVPGGA
jgi:hypothetical protein